MDSGEKRRSTGERGRGWTFGNAASVKEKEKVWTRVDHIESRSNRRARLRGRDPCESLGEIMHTSDLVSARAVRLHRGAGVGDGWNIRGEFQAI